MNEVLNAIRTRRSVRRYKPDPIPADVLKRIAEAGTWAATGMNRQSPLILVVTDRALRDRLSAMNAAILEATGTDEWKTICNDYCFQDPYVLNVEETLARMEEQNALFESFMPYL